jgi:predicted unusual protein kinase regulating ubiquinone biosynthesis (AarF/ABC1/UbiB family)
VLLEEISYVQEAHNAIRFSAMFKDDHGVYVPTIYTEYSTDKILVIEDVTSIKLTDNAALDAAGISRKAVAQRLMDTYLVQIFEKRFFHADPHPGNLFVYPLPVEEGQRFGKDGRPFYLIFIDFGMTGSLTKEISDGLVATLTAVINRDARALVQSYKKLGMILPGADMDRIEEAAVAAFDQVWGLSMTEMKNVDYQDVAALGSEFNDLLFDMPFQVPQDFIYLGRAVGILSGMCTQLDDHFNPWTELAPYAQQLAAQSVGLNVAFDGRANTGLQIVQSLFNGDGLAAISQLTQTVTRVVNPNANASREVIGRVESGDLKFTVRPNQLLKRQLDAIDNNTRRTSRMVFFGSVLISATLFYTSGGMELAGIGYAVCAATLIWGWIRK